MFNKLLPFPVLLPLNIFSSPVSYHPPLPPQSNPVVNRSAYPRPRMEDILSHIPVTAEEVEYIASLFDDFNQDLSSCDCMRRVGLNTDGEVQHDWACADFDEYAQRWLDIYRSELARAERGCWDSSEEVEEASAYVEHEDALNAQDIEAAENAAAEEVAECLIAEYFASQHHGSVVRECGCASAVGMDNEEGTVHYPYCRMSFEDDIYQSELALAESGTWDTPAH